ncbi:MAG: hypothetical protein CM15mV51_0150 [uncultured marine virus]|nr:MAG: hypothetical protein CM15mV51_0150 [uncultured marine virus]
MSIDKARILVILILKKEELTGIVTREGTKVVTYQEKEC